MVFRSIRAAIAKLFGSFIVFVFFCAPAGAQDKILFPVSASTKTPGYSPLWVAAKHGYFSQNGIEAQLVVIRGSDKAVQALVGGSVYLSISAPDAPMAAADRGLDTMIVAGNSQRPSLWVMGGKNYKTYQDLRGATIGTISLAAGTGLLLRHVLKAKGLEYPRDYKLLVIGGTPQLYTALTTNQIAAAPLSLPFNFAAEELGYNSIGSFIDVFPQYQLTVLSAKRSWAEKNRPLLVRFLQAYVRATRWLFDNPEPAIDFITKEFNFKPAHSRQAWHFYTASRVWDPDAHVSMEGMSAVIQMAAEQNQTKGRLPNPARYVDESYLNDALKELKEGK
jgi:ABC-type nitrate/sulfonate/bicarbonate transport system substrate-binding protein